jgi:predicted RNase H-like HicB family nuclease
VSALRYQMVIVWSDEDGCYLVHFPDFPEQTYRTHGNSYAEAAKNGEEVLQLLLEEDELPLPKPAAA